MDERHWQRVALRWFALCGIVVPPVDALINAIVAAQQPGYNFLRNYVSDLAAQGRPYSGVLCVWWALFPLEFGPFVVAVYIGLRGHRYGRILPVLLGLFALCMGLCGIFRFDPADPMHTFSSRVHVIVSALSGATLFPNPFFLWFATRHDDRWQRFRHFSLLMQAAGVVAVLLLALAFLRVMNWYGFAERSFWAVYYVWIVGLALELRRLSKSI